MRNPSRRDRRKCCFDRLLTDGGKLTANRFFTLLNPIASREAAASCSRVAQAPGSSSPKTISR